MTHLATNFINEFFQFLSGDAVGLGCHDVPMSIEIVQAS